jgi:hypothetical protein
LKYIEGSCGINAHQALGLLWDIGLRSHCSTSVWPPVMA